MTVRDSSVNSWDCKHLRVVLGGNKASKDGKSDDGETHGDWLLL
jgi:hypothetical protein